MMNRLPILVFILLLSGCATVTKYTEHYDDGSLSVQGQTRKHMYDGEFRTYYRNGQLWKIENYAMGELNGPYVAYYEDYEPDSSGKYAPHGAVELTSSYAMGYNDGMERRFYRDGVFAEEGSYNRSGKTGVWKQFHENGQLKFEGDFLEDSGDGVWTYYDEQGQLNNVMNMRNGRQHGEELYYYSGGKVLRTRSQYNDGELTKRELFDEKGLPVSEVKDAALDSMRQQSQARMQAMKEAYEADDQERLDSLEVEEEEAGLDFIILAFTEDDRDGEFKEYYSTGEVKVITPRKKGETDGVMKIFYRNGALARSAEYKRGKVDGAIRSYYKDGTFQLEGAMKQDNRDGVWKTYDSTGKCTETVVFDNGKLVSQQKADEQ